MTELIIPKLSFKVAIIRSLKLANFRVNDPNSPPFIPFKELLLDLNLQEYQL